MLAAPKGRQEVDRSRSQRHWHLMQEEQGERYGSPGDDARDELDKVLSGQRGRQPVEEASARLTNQLDWPSSWELWGN